MKRTFTKICYSAVVVLLFVGASLRASGQTYIASKLATNALAGAVCTDASGNIYAVEPATNNGANDGGKVVKYTNGTGSPTTIYTGTFGTLPFTDCDGDATIPSGIAVTSNGDVYVAVNFDFNPNNCSPTYGGIIKLTASTGYSESPFLAGTAAFGCFTTLAVDANDNLYTLVLDATGNGGASVGSYEIEEFPAPSFGSAPVAASKFRIDQSDACKLYVKAITTYSSALNETGLTVDPSGNIYVADGFDGGTHSTTGTVYKLAKGTGNSYTKSTFLSSLNVEGLGSDAAGNIYATYNTGFNATTLIEYVGGSTSTTHTITTSLAYSAEFEPNNIVAINNGDIYISDGNNTGDNDGIEQFVSAPATQASNVSFSGTTTTTTNITWTKGNGTTRAVFLEAGSTGTPTTATGTTYTAATAGSYTTGTQAGSGWYCIYNGSGTSMSLTGLAAATTYRVMVVDYDGTSTSTSYNTITGTNNPNNFTTVTPTISAPGGTTTLTSTVSGTPGASTSFNISGSNLLANVTVTAPSNVQVSSDNSTWNTTATITQSGGTITNSPVYVRLAGTGSVGTISGNVALSSASATTVNQAVSGTLNTPSTTISSLTAVTGTTTNAASVQYTAAFAASVSGLSTADFTLNTTGVSGASVSTVSGSGTSWTVTVNTGSGDGTIQLAMNSASGVSPTVSNVPFNGTTYTIDKTAPTVSSINASSPSNATTTNASSVIYAVTFSEPVTGVDASDFALTTSGTSGTVSGVSGSGASYAVTVSSITGTGTLRLDLKSSGTGITDGAGNAISGGFTTGNVYNIDRTAPTVSSITLAANSPTNATAVGYTVTFSEPVTGVASSAFSLVTTSGNATGVINSVTPVSTSVYTVNVTGVSGNGGLRLDLTSVSGIFDLNGNQLASGFTGSVYTIDNTPATLTSGSYFSNNGNSSQYAKVGDVLTLSVGYNEQLQSASMTIGGNTVPVSFSNGNQNFTGTYTMTSGDTEGNVGWTLSATDLAGNVRNYTNNDFGTVLIFDKTPPAISISAPSLSVTKNGPVTYTVTYSDANFNFSTLSTGDITLNATGNANATVGVSGSGTSYTVTLSGITGLGTLGFTIGAGTAADIPGNLANASSPSATFTVANNDATLTALAISNGALSPSFNTSTLAYTDNVGYTQNVIKLTPTLSDANASVTVGGNATASGTQSVAVPLSVGSNVIPVVVTAQDGVTTQEYDVTVTRAASANDTLTTLRLAPFAALTVVRGPGASNFAANEPYYVTSVTITPTFGDNDQMVTINGGQVSSGSASQPIPLNVGANTITVVITAQNGNSRTVYVTVTRAPSNNAVLAFLTLSNGATLSPAFSHNTPSYTATVLNSVSSITLKPTLSSANATVTVNGVPATSGAASAPVSLNVGDNTITVIVTAQDGVTQSTFTVVVTRQMSHNATLSFMRLTKSNGGNIPLSPAFNYLTNSYTANVASTGTITVTAKLADAGATLTINGNAAASGVASAPITINPGPNTINVAVLAADGTTTDNYNVVVTAPGSAPPITQPVESIAVATTNGLNTSGNNLVVHPGVSPNGDGVNDYLTIDGIANYPDNKLVIMNRNGALVYEAKGYDNTSKIFDGHSNKDGKMQTPGTYFYSLEYTEKGVTMHKTGYIILKY